MWEEVEDNVMDIADYELVPDVIGSTKIDRLCQIICFIPNGDKVVVFCEYTTMIDIIGFYLNALNISFITYDGRLTQEEKNDAISAFKTHDSIKVFVCNTACASYALNLQVANHVVIMQPSFNPIDDIQAIHRCECLSA